MARTKPRWRCTAPPARKRAAPDEVTARAIKRVVARQLDGVMRDNRSSKTELARRMQTSRAQLDWPLDPENDPVTLGTLTRAAHAVGRTLKMELV